MEAYSLVTGTPTSGTRLITSSSYSMVQLKTVTLYKNNVAGSAVNSTPYLTSGNPFTIAAADHDGILTAFSGAISAVAFYAGKTDE